METNTYMQLCFKLNTNINIHTQLGEFSLHVHVHLLHVTQTTAEGNALKKITLVLQACDFSFNLLFISIWAMNL